MNQAMSQGLAIGDEVIFTFGPYASVYTRAYHPDTDTLMLLGGACLGFFYWIYLILLAQGRRLHWPLLVAVASLVLVRSFDVLLYAIPFFLGLLIFKVYCLEGEGGARRKWSAYGVGLLFVPLGLLPVVKGSILVMCCAIAGLCVLCFLFHRLYRHALAVAVVPVISMGLFWMLAGQDIFGLPRYLWNMLPILAGYTEAMAIEGKGKEVVVYIAAALVLFSSIAAHGRLVLSQKLLLQGLFFVFLFLAFKAGFVRHDGHALAAAGAIVFSAISSYWLLGGRLLLFTALLCACTGWHIDQGYTARDPQPVFSRAATLYALAWNGLASRVMDPGRLKQSFDRQMMVLRDGGALPRLPGTSDIYSYDQAILIASGNEWSPRPVFQSYAAYAPALLEKNREHLQGATAADNIFFRLQSIDGRLPSLEEGSGWLSLLSRYRPVRTLKSHLLLEKRVAAGAIAQTVIYSQTHGFGEEIQLPEADQPLFARLTIKKSLLGSLVSLLYKPSQLDMRVTLEGGRVRTYRIISGMSNSVFLLSPLIEVEGEFGMLYGPAVLLDGKKVKSFSVAARGAGADWQSEFNVELTSVTIEKPTRLSEFYGLQSVDYSVASTGVRASCSGGIDRIAGGSVDREIKARGILNVDGWLASSIPDYSPLETVYLVVHGADASPGFVRANAVQRRDVANYFNSSKIESAGFGVKVDLAGLSGDYKIGLAIKKDGELKLCPNPGVVVHVEN
ncbi:MAG: hypothetical protein ABWY06_13070 [Pseudomonas sp.]|uniref:hypothetical protein n=1 Tax=Pseudomonas sp. TaxID=306 RepID=UPI003392311F